MGIRAAVIVTGTEVLTGRVADRNGPWLAERLLDEGVDIAQIVTVGDRPDDLTAALAYLAASGVDLIITSGGLGPTADDLTAEVVAGFQGRPVAVDPGLEARIGAIVAALMTARGRRFDPESTAAATRKQALVPHGAEVLAPVGTAPGLVVPPADGQAGPPVLVLPGPPRELQGMWPAALASSGVRAALAGAGELRQRELRLWGTPESELAATLREHGDALGGLEITTCLRDGELEIVTRYRPESEDTYAAFADIIEQAYPRALFSRDGDSIDAVVAEALLARHATIATAESCTGGLLAARLTARAGSSAYVLGGFTTYSNEAKHMLVGVPTGLIEQLGAVSAEVAVAMAEGARDRLGADVGVGITGVAGPGGGTADKPVGLVHLCVTDGTATLSRAINVPGDRDAVRARSVVVAMHLLRELLGA